MKNFFLLVASLRGVPTLSGRRGNLFISNCIHWIATLRFTSLAMTATCLFLLLSIINCGPSLEMTRLVPSAYDISQAKRVSLQQFQGGASGGFFSFRNERNNKLEESLYSALGQSRLFTLCSPFKSVTTFNCSLTDQNPVDAVFTGKIYDFSVKTEKYLDKREREEKTANGTRKIEYTVPMIKKTARLDVEVALMQAKGGFNLGSKRYTANEYENYEEKSLYVSSDETLKDKLIQKVTKSFIKDLSPRSEKYNVGISSNKNLQEGQQYLKDGQWFDAKRFFENYLRSNPNDAEALYSLGLAYEMDRQYDEAANHISKALSFCSKNCKTYEKALLRIENHKKDAEKYKEQVNSRKESSK